MYVSHKKVHRDVKLTEFPGCMSDWVEISLQYDLSFLVDISECADGKSAIVFKSGVPSEAKKLLRPVAAILERAVNTETREAAKVKQKRDMRSEEEGSLVLRVFEFTLEDVIRQKLICMKKTKLSKISKMSLLTIVL